MLLASCEPEMVKGGTPDGPISESDLASSFVVSGQYADINCTTPQQDGNYIAYYTSPAVNIQVYTEKDGNESILATGPSGVFRIYPPRKSPNQQNFLIRALNQDGTFTKAEKSVNVWVPTELDPELKLLLGDGEKSWTWNDEYEDLGDGSGWFYGEGGNTGSGDDFSANYFDGAWWGVYDNDSFSDYDWCTGNGHEADQDVNAYMTFTEDGTVVTYSPDGAEVRRGSWELKDWAPERPNGWEIGRIVTSAPATLFPYCIHEEGVAETEFQLMYLDENNMAFCDPESSSAGDWDNITYWMFKAK